VSNDTPGSGSPASITIQRRIEWSDTDASGHYHNTAAFRMIEWAETALFERLGLLEEIYGTLPRVHISIDFKRLLYFRQIVDISLAIAEVGASSLTYDFKIERDGELCVRAEVVTVLLNADGSKRQWSDDHRKLLLESGVQPSELLITVDDGVG
jgi:2-aminobenzoate-CoA ligase